MMKFRSQFPLIFACFLWLSSTGAKEAAIDRVYLTRQMASEIDSYIKVVNNRAWQGTPIRVGGVTFQRGLGVHADSKLVFPLKGDYVAFHVVPGPDDAQRGQLEMKILVDGKLVYSSGPTHSKDGKSRDVLRIPLVGAQSLTLMVTNTNENINGDHASWADAWLERPGYDATAIEPVTHAVTQVSREKLEPFLQEYCVECHGKTKQRGQVRFDEISWEIDNNDTAQRWQDVLDQLNGGEMPPEEATQPFDDEMSAALDTLTGSIMTARRRLTDHGGEIKMRRLNQR